MRVFPRERDVALPSSMGGDGIIHIDPYCCGPESDRALCGATDGCEEAADAPYPTCNVCIDLAQTSRFCARCGTELLLP